MNLREYLMLSKQIKSKYKTLCKKCHTKLHHVKPEIKNILNRNE